MALSQHEARIVRAIGQTLFPRDKLIDVDSVDAGVDAYVTDYLERIPQVERGLFRASLRAVDLGYKVVARDPAAQFTAASADKRQEYLESLRRSGNRLRRESYERLRVVFTMAYVDSQAVRDAVGIGERPQTESPKADNGA